MLTRSILPALVLFSALLADSARAQTPVYLWGVQRGSCESLPDVDRLIEKQLHSRAQPVALLRTPAGQPLPLCQGSRCAEVMRGSCPNASGRLLGGQVVQGKDATSFRLWLYDLSTGQIAYQDDYCQSCSLTDAVIVQAKALVENPHFGAVPGPKPSYCTRAAGDTTSAPTSSRSSGPLFLVVHGAGAHKPALHSALRAQLEALGHTPLPVTIESKTYTLDVLQKIVEGQQNARVLGAELKAGGHVELFLFDQKTGLTDDESVHCQDCAAENLIIQTKQAVATLLDHCFGAQCAGSTAAAPPVEACEPFPTEQCAGLDALLSPFAGAGPEQDHLTPRTARLLKGIAWGTFAATAATAIGLWAANPFVTQQQNGHTYDGTLIQPAGALTGIAAGLLIINIPTTIIINRAQRSAPSSGTAGRTSRSVIQCPN